MRKSSNKSFGILFFIVFLIIGLWPLYHSDPIRLWSIIVAVIFLILGLLNSRILFTTYYTRHMVLSCRLLHVELLEMFEELKDSMPFWDKR